MLLSSTPEERAKKIERLVQFEKCLLDKNNLHVSLYIDVNIYLY